MLPRFYAPEAEASLRGDGGSVKLPDEEAVHLTRVLRLGTGDPVRIFDGAGHEWRGKVATAHKQDVIVHALEPIAARPEPRIPIALALSVLKGDKMDDVVRDAVMLGASMMTPLITARTEISLSSVRRSGRIARWHRIAVASAKQCGRAVVPPIEAAVPVGELLQRPATGARLMLVEPTMAKSQDVRAVPVPDRAELLVGPEGGWDPDEVRQAQACDALAVTLGALTLRADAVPLVALTSLRTIWNDL